MLSQLATREHFKRLREEAKGNETVLHGLAMAETILDNAGDATWEEETFIGLPHIHGVEFGTAKGIIHECSEKIHLCTLQDYCTSLLAWGFNHLWCDALNTRKEVPGGAPRCKYSNWLLCHADISFRTPRFLDVMLGHLHRGKWDALHVPMAIKDDRGLTSTGIGNGDDKWGRIRRLTTAELQRLPPVFGLDEMVEVMKRDGAHVPDNPVFCPNTGCLLVRVDERWAWDFPGFAIEDRLVTRVDGEGRCRRTPMVVPEDWNFGFWMQGRGLRVGGVKQVRTNHHCSMFYTNDRTWGEAKDEGYLKDPMNW